MNSTSVFYFDQESELEGFVAYPAQQKKRPLVILCHTWRGRDDFICAKAEEVANWGYVGFALDMYGKGVLGKSKEENAALKQPFIEDRKLLQRRLLKGYDVARALPYVDSSRIAILGFGFGGLCALDLARSGTDLRGAISIYGHLDAPHALPKKQMKAKVLVLHGRDDPIVSSSELSVFECEMEESNTDWQVHIYGHTMHAFASPSANDPKLGICYNPTSAKRAWREIHNFLEEIMKESCESGAS